MNRLGFEICLIAVVAAGCSSHPPREIPRTAENRTAEQYADQPNQNLVALPDAASQAARLEYETLSALPAAGSRALSFHLGSQTFDYVEDDQVIVSGPIASGKADSPTPTGTFSVLSKDKDKQSSLYDNEVGTPAWMPYSMQFYGNYFVHEGWLPGFPASHGCIRLDHYHAKLLFERMRIGDRVTVSN